MPSWTGRRNECKPCRLSKNHKHTLISILIIICSIVIHNSEFNSHNIQCVLN